MKRLVAFVAVTAATIVGPARAQPNDATTETVKAANALLSALTADQRRRVPYDFDDETQRARWSNFPTGFVPRGGLALKKLSAVQREATPAPHPIFPGRETLVSACFGLVLGLAFAATLDHLGVDPRHRLADVVAFNAGIETMQLLVVAAVLPSLLLMRRMPAYRTLRIAAPRWPRRSRSAGSSRGSSTFARLPMPWSMRPPATQAGSPPRCSAAVSRRSFADGRSSRGPVASVRRRRIATRPTMQERLPRRRPTIGHPSPRPA